MFSLRIKLDDERPVVVPGMLGVGPDPDARNVRAVDDPPLASDLSGIPSIILAVWESDPSCFGFFRRAPAAAVFCLAARAGGSSRTSSYSLRIREARPARSASWKGFSLGRWVK